MLLTNRVSLSTALRISKKKVTGLRLLTRFNRGDAARHVRSRPSKIELKRCLAVYVQVQVTRLSDTDSYGRGSGDHIVGGYTIRLRFQAGPVFFNAVNLFCDGSPCHGGIYLG